jgi:hypothetical protein
MNLHQVIADLQRDTEQLRAANVVLAENAERMRARNKPPQQPVNPHLTLVKNDDKPTTDR